MRRAVLLLLADTLELERLILSHRRMLFGVLGVLCRLGGRAGAEVILRVFGQLGLEHLSLPPDIILLEPYLGVRTLFEIFCLAFHIGLNPALQVDLRLRDVGGGFRADLGFLLAESVCQGFFLVAQKDFCMGLHKALVLR